TSRDARVPRGVPGVRHDRPARTVPPEYDVVVSAVSDRPGRAVRRSRNPTRPDDARETGAARDAPTAAVPVNDQRLDVPANELAAVDLDVLALADCPGVAAARGHDRIELRVVVPK